MSKLKRILRYDDFIKENIDYYISKDNKEIQVSRDEFIKIGMENNFTPKKNNEKGFHIETQDGKFVAKITEETDMTKYKELTKAELATLINQSEIAIKDLLDSNNTQQAKELTLFIGKLIDIYASASA